MIEFYDSSVLIAVFWGDHPHHPASIAAFAAATKDTGACGLHSLAEVYSVTTRLPIRPMISPEQAILFLEEIRRRLTIVSLDEVDYFSTIEEIATRGVSGGRVYDALLLKCAANSNAKVIYTWNLDHFKLIAPDLADRIMTP